MKHLFTLVIFTILTITAHAQQGPMQFAGPSKFGVEAMNAWQENESDTIIFAMKSTTEADITLPALTYNAMGLTIPSFTIHGLKFDFNYSNRNATFPEQTYSETVEIDGQQKTITGSSFEAEYVSATNAFTLTTRLSYGRMPVVVTYILNASYVKNEAGIDLFFPESPATDNYMDLSGRKILSPRQGQVYIQKGKKYLKK